MPHIEGGPPGTRYIRLTINVWYQQSDGQIHIAAVDPSARFHTTVKNDPDSERYHKKLWDHLKRLLAEQGKWPEG